MPLSIGTALATNQAKPHTQPKSSLQRSASIASFDLSCEYIYTTVLCVHTLNNMNRLKYLKTVRGQEHVDATHGCHQLARWSVGVVHHLLHDPAVA